MQPHRCRRESSGTLQNRRSRSPPHRCRRESSGTLQDRRSRSLPPCPRLRTRQLPAIATVQLSELHRQYQQYLSPVRPIPVRLCQHCQCTKRTTGQRNVPVRATPDRSHQHFPNAKYPAAHLSASARAVPNQRQQCINELADSANLVRVMLPPCDSRPRCGCSMAQLQYSCRMAWRHGRAKATK